MGGDCGRSWGRGEERGLSGGAGGEESERGVGWVGLEKTMVVDGAKGGRWDGDGQGCGEGGMVGNNRAGSSGEAGRLGELVGANKVRVSIKPLGSENASGIEDP